MASQGHLPHQEIVPANDEPESPGRPRLHTGAVHGGGAPLPQSPPARAGLPLHAPHSHVIAEALEGLVAPRSPAARSGDTPQHVAGAHAVPLLRGAGAASQPQTPAGRSSGTPVSAQHAVLLAAATASQPQTPAARGGGTPHTAAALPGSGGMSQPPTPAGWRAGTPLSAPVASQPETPAANSAGTPQHAVAGAAAAHDGAAKLSQHAAAVAAAFDGLGASPDNSRHDLEAGRLERESSRQALLGHSGLRSSSDDGGAASGGGAGSAGGAAPRQVTHFVWAPKPWFLSSAGDQRRPGAEACIEMGGTGARPPNGAAAAAGAALGGAGLGRGHGHPWRTDPYARARVLQLEAPSRRVYAGGSTGGPARLPCSGRALRWGAGVAVAVLAAITITLVALGESRDVPGAGIGERGLSASP
jgi:hypothetical protein